MQYYKHNGNYVKHAGSFMTTPDSSQSKLGGGGGGEGSGSEWSGISYTTNLVGYWAADNPSSYPGSGTTWTDIQQDIGSTLTNGPTWTSSTSVYFDFDGTDDYMTAGDVLDIGTGDYGVGMWVKYDTTSPSIQYSISKSARGNLSDRWGCGVYPNKPFWYTMIDSSEGDMIWTSNTTISTGTWYYFFFSVDRSNTVSIYIDGTATSVTANTAATDRWDNQDGENVNSTFDLWFGGHPDSNGTSNFLPMNGQIGEIHIYSSTLTAAQVLQNYNETSSKYPNA